MYINRVSAGFKKFCAISQKSYAYTYSVHESHLGWSSFSLEKSGFVLCCVALRIYLHVHVHCISWKEGDPVIEANFCREQSSPST